jgi:DNA sulfur modification protein DndD
MILDDIVLHNFGVFRGRQRAVLTPVSRERNIILFGGLNGAGKTTLLEGLLLGLFGRHAPGLRGNGGYDDYLRKSVNRSAPPGEGARIEIRFRSVVDGRERSYCVARAWTAPKSRVSEHLDVFVDDRHDQGLSDTWSERVDQFIPPSLAPLFFFDGERIESLADAENTADMLSTALHSLLGLDLVGTLQNDLVTLERRKRSNQDPEPDREALEAACAQVAEIDEAVRAAKQSVAGLRTRNERVQAKLKKVNDEYAKKGGSLAEQQHDLEKRADRLAKDLEGLDKQLIDVASGSLPLVLVRPLLEDIAEDAEREETAHRAQILGEVLAARDHRLLATLQTAKAAEETVTAVEHYLTAENEQLAEAQDCERYLELNPDANADLRVLLQRELDADVNRTALLLGEARSLTTQLETLESSLAAVPDSESLNELVADRQRLQTVMEDLGSSLEKEEKGLATQEFEQARRRRHLDKLHEEQAAVDLKNQDAARFVAHSERLREVLGRFRTRMVAQHIERLEELILESYQALIRKNSLVASVRIDPKTYGLHLSTQEGHRIEPERLSAGERQLLAVAMLWALARASGRPLPTAVDTPLGRLDATHRKHLVERYFPFASHQVLLFSTDEEIDEGLLESLKRRIGHTYHLTYDDATSSTTIEKGYFW